MRDAPTWDDLAWLHDADRAAGVDQGRAASRRCAPRCASAGRRRPRRVEPRRAQPRWRAGQPRRAAGGPRRGRRRISRCCSTAASARGADVFKALALGADAVLVGRLQLYALAVAGALGVAHMIKLLREELEVCMALAGCATPRRDRSAAAPNGYPSGRNHADHHRKRAGQGRSAPVPRLPRPGRLAGRRRHRRHAGAPGQAQPAARRRRATPAISLGNHILRALGQPSAVHLGRAAAQDLSAALQPLRRRRHLRHPCRQRPDAACRARR